MLVVVAVVVEVLVDRVDTVAIVVIVEVVRRLVPVRVVLVEVAVAVEVLGLGEDPVTVVVGVEVVRQQVPVGVVVARVAVLVDVLVDALDAVVVVVIIEVVRDLVPVVVTALGLEDRVDAVAVVVLVEVVGDLVPVRVVVGGIAVLVDVLVDRVDAIAVVIGVQVVGDLVAVVVAGALLEGVDAVAVIVLVEVVRDLVPVRVVVGRIPVLVQVLVLGQDPVAVVVIVEVVRRLVAVGVVVAGVAVLVDILVDRVDTVAVVVDVPVVRDLVPVGVDLGVRAVEVVVDAVAVLVRPLRRGLGDAVAIGVPGLDDVLDAVTIGVIVQVVRRARAVGVGRTLDRAGDAVAVVVHVHVVGLAVAVGVGRALGERRDAVGVVVGIGVVGEAVAVEVELGVLAVEVVVPAVAVLVGAGGGGVGGAVEVVIPGLDDVVDAVAVGVGVAVVGSAGAVAVRRTLGQGRDAIAVVVHVAVVDQAVGVGVGLELRDRVHAVIVIVGVEVVVGLVAVGVDGGGVAIGLEGVVDAVAVGVRARGRGVRGAVAVRVPGLEQVADAVPVGVGVQVVAVAVAVGVGRALVLREDAVAVVVLVVVVLGAVPVGVGLAVALGDVGDAVAILVVAGRHALVGAGAQAPVQLDAAVTLGRALALRARTNELRIRVLEPGILEPATDHARVEGRAGGARTGRLGDGRVEGVARIVDGAVVEVVAVAVRVPAVSARVERAGVGLGVVVVAVQRTGETVRAEAVPVGVDVVHEVDVGQLRAALPVRLQHREHAGVLSDAGVEVDLALVAEPAAKRPLPVAPGAGGITARDVEADPVAVLAQLAPAQLDPHGAQPAVHRGVAGHPAALVVEGVLVAGLVGLQCQGEDRGGSVDPHADHGARGVGVVEPQPLGTGGAVLVDHESEGADRLPRPVIGHPIPSRADHVRARDLGPNGATGAVGVAPGEVDRGGADVAAQEQPRAEGGAGGAGERDVRAGDELGDRAAVVVRAGAEAHATHGDRIGETRIFVERDTAVCRAREGAVLALQLHAEGVRTICERAAHEAALGVAQADALDEDPAVGDPDVVGLAGGLRRSTHHGRVRGQGDRSDHAEQHGGEEQREGATHENPVSGGQTARKIPKAAPQWAATLGVSTRVGAGRGPAQNAQSSGRGGLPSSAAPKAVGSSTSSNPPATVPRSARPP